MTNPVLTNHVKHLIKSLVAQGVRHFIVSPGSRSTPVALLLAEYVRHVNSQVKLYIAVDERDAAFMALGLAKEQQTPVALLATSGTATANYLPAITEAHLSHVPLVVLTTDRPQELQAIGAPQTMQQVDLYGGHVKDSLLLNLQDAHTDVADYIDYKVQHLVHDATIQPAGPVQINLPLRKPLMPDLGTPWPEIIKQSFIGSEQMVDLTHLHSLLAGKKIALLAGPAETTWFAEAFQTLAEKWQVPVLADALSGVRGQANMMVGIDTLLAADAIAADLVPDVVLRFGGTPVSGRVLPWLKEHNVLEIQVGTQHIGHDHSRHAAVAVAGDEMTILSALTILDLPIMANYLAGWQQTQAALTQVQVGNVLTEMSVAKALAHLSADQQIFLANSMVIRDFDNYWQPTQIIKTMANRGANGIDGTIASAVGMALNGKPTWLPIGDLTLFHDMNGLMLAKQNQIDLTLIVTNNNGGGIFSFLPQSQADEYFEEMFGTPQDLDVAAIAKLYGATYQQIASEQDLDALVATPWQGLRFVEIRTTRGDNVAVHAQRVAALKEVTHD